MSTRHLVNLEKQKVAFQKLQIRDSRRKGILFRALAAVLNNTPAFDAHLESHAWATRWATISEFEKPLILDAIVDERSIIMHRILSTIPSFGKFFSAQRNLRAGKDCPHGHHVFDVFVLGATLFHSCIRCVWTL